MLQFFIFYILVLQTFASNQYLVCKTVPGIFGNNSETPGLRGQRGQRGPQGKRGPRGERGPQGQRGLRVS